MKNNRDKLSNAFNYLRGDTLQEALTAMETMTPIVTKATHKRRWLTATAACLTAALALGAVLALPMLRTDEPSVPSETLPATDAIPSVGELSYYDAPIVRLDRLSETEISTVSDPSIPTNNLNVNFMQTDYFSNLHVLVFDCLPGETVTIRANRECLGYVEMAYDPDSFYPKGDLEKWKSVLEYMQSYQELCRELVHRSTLENYYKKPVKVPDSTETDESYTFYERELTIDPASSSIILCFDYSEPEDGIEEDVILYTVTNEEGQITGAGGFYVGKQYIGSPQHRTPERAVTIARAAVLGSVRFTDPANVTEEQVEALLATYAEEGKDGRSMVDFSPVTYEEINAVAGREIVQAVSQDHEISGMGRGIGYYTDYSFFSVHLSDTDQELEFIIFKDGTWAEIDREVGEHKSSNGHQNAECPNTEKYGYHGIGRNCIVKTTDGRFYLLENYDLQNPENTDRIYTAVLIDQPTA